MTTTVVLTQGGKKIDGAKLAEHVKELESLDERRVDINKEFSKAYQRAADSGFNKRIVKAVVGRRKKDRDRVVAEEQEIHDYEIALGMRTMDMPLEAPQSTAESLAPQAGLTEAEKAAEEAEAQNGGAVATVEDAYNMGHAAKLAGQDLAACPWKRSTKLGKSWTNGYNDAANEPDSADDGVDEAEEEEPTPAEEPEPLAAQEPTAEPEPDEYRPGPELQEGRKAYENGLGSHACPYDAGTQAAADWVVGWNERAGEDTADQPAEPSHVDRTEHMSPEEYRAAVGADEI